MDKNNFSESVNELLQGLDSFVSSKTTIGDPIRVGEKIIIPLMDVKLGVGAGSYTGKANGSAGGMGASLVPSSVIIVEKNNVRLVRIQNDDVTVKILDMLPELIGRVKNKFEKPDKAVDEAIDDIRNSAKNMDEE